MINLMRSLEYKLVEYEGRNYFTGEFDSYCYFFKDNKNNSCLIILDENKASLNKIFRYKESGDLDLFELKEINTKTELLKILLLIERGLL